MHCRSELVWKNGIPSESIAGQQIITATLASKRAEGEKLRYSDMPPQLRPDEQQMKSIERIRTRMAKQLATKFRDDATNDRSTSLALGVCLVFGILYWVLPSSPLLAILFGLSLVATVAAYLASRHNSRL